MNETRRPHVPACAHGALVALLRTRFPHETLDQVLARLREETTR